MTLKVNGLFADGLVDHRLDGSMRRNLVLCSYRWGRCPKIYIYCRDGIDEALSRFRFTLVGCINTTRLRAHEMKMPGEGVSTLEFI